MEQSSFGESHAINPKWIYAQSGSSPELVPRGEYADIGGRPKPIL